MRVFVSFCLALSLLVLIFAKPFHILAGHPLTGAGQLAEVYVTGGVRVEKRAQGDENAEKGDMWGSKAQSLVGIAPQAVEGEGQQPMVPEKTGKHENLQIFLLVAVAILVVLLCFLYMLANYLR